MDPSASPTAVTREELHCRRIEMRGWRRSDGFFEVEGRLIDTKPTDFVPLRGGTLVEAGLPIHNLGVRLTFDDELIVRAVETFTESAPYDICPAGGRALQALVGLKMSGGWGQAVRSQLARADSCTHLRELLVPMATVAHQALSFRLREQPERLDAEGRPMRIDSCYAYGAERSLVQRLWPQFHRPTDTAG
jgi:hypothetical protein